MSRSFTLARVRDTLVVLLALGFVLWMTFGGSPQAHASGPSTGGDQTYQARD